MPEKIPVTMEAAPNIPAVDAYLGSTVLQENILVSSLEQLFKLIKALHYFVKLVEDFFLHSGPHWAE